MKNSLKMLVLVAMAVGALLVGAGSGCYDYYIAAEPYYVYDYGWYGYDYYDPYYDEWWYDEYYYDDWWYDDPYYYGYYY